MEGKCLPRPPNSLAAKEGLLILALILPSSTSPEKGPPPSTHGPTVSGLSFLRSSACSLLPAHGHHATPRGLVSIAESWALWAFWPQASSRMMSKPLQHSHRPSCQAKAPSNRASVNRGALTLSSRKRQKVSSATRLVSGGGEGWGGSSSHVLM